VAVLKLFAVLRFIWHSTVLLGIGLVGGTVTAAGVVMLITPGPGLLVIIAGLAILATQFAWAERALDKVKQRAIAARDKASARRAVRRTDPGPAGAGPSSGSQTSGSGSQTPGGRAAESLAAESQAEVTLTDQTDNQATA